MELDPFKEAKAYNISIYLMVAMPYLLLGTVGFLVYRGLKQKAKAEQHALSVVRCPLSVATTAVSEQRTTEGQRTGQGDPSCLSHGESS